MILIFPGRAICSNFIVENVISLIIYDSLTTNILLKLINKGPETNRI